MRRSYDYEQVRATQETQETESSGTQGHSDIDIGKRREKEKEET